jgi:hypothetical protein
MHNVLQQLFLQIFTVVIGFGLFHGLVFLPVLLSLVGPQPFSNTQKDTNEAHENGNGVAKASSSVEMKSLTNGNSSNGHCNVDNNQQNTDDCTNEPLPIDPLLTSISVQS